MMQPLAIFLYKNLNELLEVYKQKIYSILT